MDLDVAVIMFLLLMANTWWNYRQGFKKGAAGGHFVGIHDLTAFLMEKNYLDAVNTTEDRPATADEMTAYFIKTLHERKLKKLENSEA
jgi:hypothetical protein